MGLRGTHSPGDCSGLLVGDDTSTGVLFAPTPCPPTSAHVRGDLCICDCLSPPKPTPSSADGAWDHILLCTHLHNTTFKPSFVPGNQRPQKKQGLVQVTVHGKSPEGKWLLWLPRTELNPSYHIYIGNEGPLRSWLSLHSPFQIGPFYALHSQKNTGMHKWKHYTNLYSYKT